MQTHWVRLPQPPQFGVNDYGSSVLYPLPVLLDDNIAGNSRIRIPLPLMRNLTHSPLVTLGGICFVLFGRIELGLVSLRLGKYNVAICARAHSPSVREVARDEEKTLTKFPGVSSGWRVVCQCRLSCNVCYSSTLRE